MEIFEEAYAWLLQHKKWLVRTAKFLNSLLMLAATLLSGVAAWYSFRAAEEANATAKQANATAKHADDIATAAYQFTVRSTNDTNALQQPSLSVVSGKIAQGETEGEGYSKTTRYHVELHVQNSGGRDATPVWIALGDEFGSPWSQAKKLATIAKGQESFVIFEVLTSNTQLKDLRALAVGLRYLDSKPEYQFEHPVTSAKTFQRICSTPKVLTLTMLRPKTESGTTEATLVMGASIPNEDLDMRSWTPELAAGRNALKAMSSLDASECEADKPQ